MAVFKWMVRAYLHGDHIQELQISMHATIHVKMLDLFRLSSTSFKLPHVSAGIRRAISSVSVPNKEVFQ